MGELTAHERFALAVALSGTPLTICRDGRYRCPSCGDLVEQLGHRGICLPCATAIGYARLGRMEEERESAACHHTLHGAELCPRQRHGSAKTNS